jgi:hypothetical protein
MIMITFLIWACWCRSKHTNIQTNKHTNKQILVCTRPGVVLSSNLYVSVCVRRVHVRRVRVRSQGFLADVQLYKVSLACSVQHAACKQRAAWYALEVGIVGGPSYTMQTFKARCVDSVNNNVHRFIHVSSITSNLLCYSTCRIYVYIDLHNYVKIIIIMYLKIFTWHRSRYMYNNVFELYILY